MQKTRRVRLVLASLLGLSLVSAGPVRGQTAEGDVSIIEGAVCYANYIGDLVTDPVLAGNNYGQCIERAMED